MYPQHTHKHMNTITQPYRYAYRCKPHSTEHHLQCQDFHSFTITYHELSWTAFAQVAFLKNYTKNIYNGRQESVQMIHVHKRLLHRTTSWVCVPLNKVKANENDIKQT